MTASKRKSRKRPRGTATRPRETSSGRAPRDPEGRRHLRVYQDATTGARRVGLAAPIFSEAWQNELTVSAAHAVLVTLQGGVDESAVVRVARAAMDSTSKLAEGLLAQAEDGQVACKSGCDHCCYQSVGVTPAEALTIVDHLKQTRSKEELDKLGEELAVTRDRTRGLSSAERFSPEHPCPFLTAATCSIYPVRPLSCRGMNALDAEECRRSLREPEAREAFLRTGEGRSSFLEPIRAFHAISAGLQIGLSELHGLDMRPLDLTAAIDELLKAPPSLLQEWLSGQSPLEGARGADSTGRVDIQNLSGLAPPAKSTHSGGGA